MSKSFFPSRQSQFPLDLSELDSDYPQNSSQTAVERYAKPSENYEEKWIRSVEILRQMAANYPNITQASSLGAEDMVITHMLHRNGIASEIFILETGKLHPQTMALLEFVQQELGDKRSVKIYRPDAKKAHDFVEFYGEEAMYDSVELRKQCCHIRKMEPLVRALEGKDAWITGIRSEQSESRGDMRMIGQDDKGRVKVSPLLDWTWGDVWHYIGDNEVPYNPLHDDFYPSIGCAPCTRAISMGEPFRAGRWWWEQDGAKECGLHVQGAQVVSVLTKA